MNDLINNVLDRYQSFKKGDRSATAEINPAFQKKGSKSSSSRASAKAAPAPNLIDFDEPAPAPSSNSNGGASSGNPMDDNFGLEGLCLGPSTAAPSSAGKANTTSSNGGGLLDGLDFGASSSSSSTPSVQASQSNFYQQYQPTLPSGALQQPSISWGNLSAPQGQANRTPSSLAPSMFGQGTSSSSASRTPSSISSAVTQQQQQQQQSSLRPSTPGAITLGMMGTIPPTSPMGQSSYAPQQTQQQQRSQNTSQPVKLKDPFDDLLNM
jgi:ADP-ribosylation factor-binding protein GGA